VDEEDLAITSALRTADIEHASARLKSFKAFPDDWDGENGMSPDEDVIDSAIVFLQRLQPWHPRPLSSLDSYGNPVVEFRDEETGLFGKVRFTSTDKVEMFVVIGENEPEFLEGNVASVDVVQFLSDQFQITLQP